MSCEQVREHLAEHLLGTLERPVDLEVRRHLRGCAACRREMSALAEGMSTFARATHDVDPPEQLRDHVLATLDEEWRDGPIVLPDPRRRAMWLGRAAVALTLAGALAWGAVATTRAGRFHAEALKYETFLGVLGGENVRVGQLEATGAQQLEGSVVMYDSRVQQSWVLVLVHAPGLVGNAHVTLLSGDHRIEMRPLEFGGGGEAATWLVTSSNLASFDTVTIWDDSGQLASAKVEAG